MIHRILSKIKSNLLKLKRERIFIQIKGYFCDRKAFKSSKKRIFVVSTPEYGNLGDHAIALAEMSILRETFPEREIIDISDSEFLPNFLKLKFLTKTEDVFCLIGGGNFGVIYPETEYVRRKIIRGCKRNRVVLFPQTMDFGNREESERELQKTKKIYGEHKNVLLMAREDSSFDKMKSAFPSCQVVEAPDVVLTWKVEMPIQRVEKRAIVCFRDDGEKLVKDCDKHEVIEELTKKGFRVVAVDTEKNKTISADKRKEEVMEMLEKFASAEVVITDRLHGMIFSCITNTPCIAYDNYNHKISGVYKWIRNVDFMCMRDEKQSLDAQINGVLSFSGERYDNSHNKEMIQKILTGFILD